MAVPPESRCALGHVETDEAANLMAGYVPTFRSGDELPREGVFALALQPGNRVRFVVGSTRAFGDLDGYGGVVTFPKVPAGRYRLRLSRPADLELLQNYRTLPLLEIPGDDPALDADLDGGSFALQIRSPTADPIAISILPLRPCPAG